MGEQKLGTQKLVLLHSNDTHGDFVAEVQGAEGNLIGGLPLSGVLTSLRTTRPTPS